MQLNVRSNEQDLPWLLPSHGKKATNISKKTKDETMKDMSA